MEKPVNSLFDVVMSMKNRTTISLRDSSGYNLYSGVVQRIENEGGKDIYIVTYKDGRSICCKLI